MMDFEKLVGELKFYQQFCKDNNTSFKLSFIIDKEAVGMFTAKYINLHSYKFLPKSYNLIDEK